MNAIVLINLWGKKALAFAWPMLWQSSLLIGVLFALDLGLKRKVRASVRYALWLVVLIKLMLPPSLAFPSGVAWWLCPATIAPAVQSDVGIKVVYGNVQADSLPKPHTVMPTASSTPAVSLAGFALAAWISLSFALLGWMLVRSRQVARIVRGASVTPQRLQELLEDARRSISVPCSVSLRLLDRSGSPTVSGLFHPTILVPKVLAGQLTPDQMRVILLHELMHVRRGDAWINCAQALLQIFYCWHPLLWLANARIRWAREEAVDDAVMVALGSHSGTYAPTLLEVAKVALPRPLASVGPIGILESRSFLRQRIERLIEFHPPAKGLKLISAISVLAFAAVALPMGEAPPSAPPISVDSTAKLWPDARFDGYAEIDLEAQFLIAPEASLHEVLPSLTDAREPLLVSSNEVTELGSLLDRALAQPYSTTEPLSFGKFSGGTFHWLVGGATNNAVNYLTRITNGKNIVTGADATVVAMQPGWFPLELTLIPWLSDSGVRCQMRFSVADNPNAAQTADTTIPKGGVLIWSTPVEPGKYELVLLRHKSRDVTESPAGNAPMEQNKQVLESEHIQLSPKDVPTKAEALLGEPVSASDEPSGATHESRIGRFGYDRSYRANPKGEIVAASDELITNAKRSAAPARPTDERVMALLKQEVIRDKLLSIRVPRVSFNNVPLRQVLERLSGYVPDTSSGEKSMTFNYEREPTDIGDVRITILPAIVDISLEQLVDAVAKVAPQPLTYSITATGVVFARRFEKPTNQANPQINIKTKFITLPAESSLSLWSLLQGTNLPIDGGTNLTMVLTPAQSAVLMKALESNPGGDLIREASVTTLSGRETEAQVVDLKTVVTNLDPQALSRPGISSKPNGTNGLYQAATIPFGPILDSVASVQADGKHIQLVANVTSTEFLGYDDPKGKVPAYVDGKRTYVVRPLPHFREAKVAATVVVPDGYTLLLRASMTDESQSPTPVPRLKKKELIVLVTPILIDPAGNRVHPDN
jgi:beta-lactamase regulating signal transducer with metallopeptidase domain